ncbi:MAG: hypothetical protein WBB31_04415, partial [Saprospiraceae bacterium]
MNRWNRIYSGIFLGEASDSNEYKNHLFSRISGPNNDNNFEPKTPSNTMIISSLDHRGTTSGGTTS